VADVSVIITRFLKPAVIKAIFRVPTNLENLELSGNFVYLEKPGEKSGNLIYGQGIFL